MSEYNNNKYPSGGSLPFPFDPYPQQVELMDALLQGIANKNSDDDKGETKTRLLLLESPTGTGKSLSLACASLAWLHHQKKVRKERLEQQNQQRNISPTSVSGIDWLDDWQPSAASESTAFSTEIAREEALVEKLQALRLQYQSSPRPDESRQNLIQQAVRQAKFQARKRQRKRKKDIVSLSYENEDENNESTQEKRFPVGSPEWFLQKPPPPPQRPPAGSTTESCSLPHAPKIVYAARTHSQLSQFLKEVKRTQWGATTRVVTLASREQGLCSFYSKQQHPVNHNNLTDACLDLRNSSSSGCSHYNNSSMATLALHSLTQPTDLEDLAQLGQTTHTCPYYASRLALAQAELILVPYTLLVDADARTSLGLDLTNALVLVDEAHNLATAITSLSSSALSHAQIQASLHQLQSFTEKYLEQLSPRNLQFLGQLKTLANAFLKVTAATTSTTALLQSPSEFLCHQHLENINIFPLLRYLDESKLSQKLLGFLPKDYMTEQGLSLHFSPLRSVQTFLQRLVHGERDGKLVMDPPHLKYVVLNPAVKAKDDLYHLPRAVCLVGGTLQPWNSLLQELRPDLLEPGSGGVTTKFSCGHVVDKSHVLLQALDQTDGVRIDVRHATRELPSVTHAIGQALLRLVVEGVSRGGVVVFVPSYKYEQVLIDAWKASGMWDQLNRVLPVFREPRQSKEIPQLLQDYGAAVGNGSGGADHNREKTASALLLSVVGGKLSEGINFANDMCRCVVVVGLPFADKSDPMLQEKLRLVKNPSDYYTSMCLRAVNQSVGRAIRHAKDYACVIVMDPRYATQREIATGLPQWLRESTPDWRSQSHDLESVLTRVRSFFQQDFGDD